MKVSLIIERIALVILLIGGLNWGIIGLFDYNVVSELFGTTSATTRIIYSLVGISVLYVAVYSIIPGESYRESSTTHSIRA